MSLKHGPSSEPLPNGVGPFHATDPARFRLTLVLGSSPMKELLEPAHYSKIIYVGVDPTLLG